MFHDNFNQINQDMELGKYHQVLNKLEALELNKENDKKLKILLLADIWIFKGNYVKAEQILDDDLLRSIDNQYLIIYYTIIRSSLLDREGKQDQSFEILISISNLVNNQITERNIKDMENLQSKWIARYYHTIGNELYKLGKLEEALDNFEKSINIKKIIEDSKGIASSLNKLSQIYRFKGDLRKSMSLANTSLAIDKQLGNMQAVAVTLLSISRIYRELDNNELALDALNQCLNYLQKEKNLLLICMTYYELFIITIKQDFDLSAKYVEHINRIYQEARNDKTIETMSKLVNALILKHTKRGKDIYKSQEMLKEIVDDNIVDYRLTIQAILNLVELLLMELENFGNEEILVELIQLTEKIRRISLKYHSYPLIVEINLITARFEVINGNIIRANKIYNDTIAYASIHGLIHLLKKAEDEKNIFEKELRKYEELVNKGAPIFERISSNEIQDYIDQISSIINF